MEFDPVAFSLEYWKEILICLAWYAFAGFSAVCINFKVGTATYYQKLRDFWLIFFFWPFIVIGMVLMPIYELLTKKLENFFYYLHWSSGEKVKWKDYKDDNFEPEQRKKDDLSESERRTIIRTLANPFGKNQDGEKL